MDDWKNMKFQTCKTLTIELREPRGAQVTVTRQAKPAIPFSFPATCANHGRNTIFGATRFAHCMSAISFASKAVVQVTIIGPGAFDPRPYRAQLTSATRRHRSLLAGLEDRAPRDGGPPAIAGHS